MCNKPKYDPYSKPATIAYKDRGDFNEWIKWVFNQLKKYKETNRPAPDNNGSSSFSDRKD